MVVLKGLFAFEGIDGSGKTTLCKTLSTTFSHLEYAMQPSEGFYGKLIRENLKGPSPLPPSELLDLFIKDREEHQKFLLEKIKKGKKIILDRYVLSTLAYQGLYFSLESLWERNSSFYIPEKTFFLNTPIDIALSRRKKENQKQGITKDMFEVEELQSKILENYQKAIPFLEDKGYDVVTLDGCKDIASLVKECYEYIGEV